MPTLEEIHEQLKSSNVEKMHLGKKEIKELPSILWDDEKIEKLTSGLYNNGSGIFVATNKRVLFVDKGILFGLKVEDFPYDKISSIQYKTGFVMGEIKIFCSGNKAEITHVPNEDAKNISEYIRARSTPITANSSATQEVTNKGSPDFISMLERLAALKNQGILTEEEFLTQKQKILNP